MERVVGAEPFPPGEYIQDELDARGWTQDDLASVMGMTRRQIVNLISGSSGVTPQTAVLLGQALGQSAELWMQLQISYELAKTAQDDRAVAERAALFERYPIRLMIKRGWIADDKTPKSLATNVCKFFHIKTPEEVPTYKWVARKVNYDKDTPAQMAWYFRAKQLAECVSVQKYDPKKIDDVAAELRKLMLNKEDVRLVPRTLAKGGIRFVIVERLDKSGVDGGAFWLGDSPVIAMSLRYDRIDNFWFTLGHELDHVRNQDESIDSELMETADCDLPPIEKRANLSAANYLIPKDKLESFILRSRPLFYQKRVVQFANSQGVHAGIVVGQLQRRGCLKYSQLRQLLEKVKSAIVGEAITDGWGDCPNI